MLLKQQINLLFSFILHIRISCILFRFLFNFIFISIAFGFGFLLLLLFDWCRRNQCDLISLILCAKSENKEKKRNRKEKNKLYYSLTLEVFTLERKQIEFKLYDVEVQVLIIYCLIGISLYKHWTRYMRLTFRKLPHYYSLTKLKRLTIKMATMIRKVHKSVNIVLFISRHRFPMNKIE